MQETEVRRRPGRPSRAEAEAKAALEKSRGIVADPSRYSNSLSVSLPAGGWRLRDYQHPLWDYLEGGGTRAVINWHRRAGKDLFGINRIAWCMTQRPGLYWHVFPTYNQGRKIIWEGYRNDGVPYRHAFPAQLVSSENNTEMRLSLSIGSTYQVVGADDPDRLVGANPIGIILSEFALMDNAQQVWNLLSPILAANGGWVIFIATPRGRNFFWKMYDYAGGNPDWFRQTLTIADTTCLDPISGLRRPVVLQKDIEEARGQGTEEAIIQQEYYGSFEAPLSGSFYGTIMDNLETQGRITSVPWEPRLPVHTAWDLGVRDATSIICYQKTPGENRIIDGYTNSGEPLSTYIKWLHEKPYVYGDHWAPHDIKVKELGSGKTRLETARSMGVRFRICPKHTVSDGIEAVRNFLQNCWFDREKSTKLLEALRGYRKKYVPELQTFSSEPIHDKFSHFADAFRYLAFSSKPEPFSRGNSRQNETSDPGHDEI